ncbi:MAG: PCYCGC domain-containing protein, partial [Spirochaetota bacterium]|nr:PCYCGC domain-containing protein [Spirochaetota bacterium]
TGQRQAHNKSFELPKVFPKALGGETRPTLSPVKYANNPEYGRAVEAYTAAKKIPHILDQIFCYCYCQDNPKYKHKSLLTCYTDDHSASCGICQMEAITAYELYKQNTPIDTIISKINKKYYHPKH